MDKLQTITDKYPLVRRAKFFNEIKRQIIKQSWGVNKYTDAEFSITRTNDTEFEVSIKFTASQTNDNTDTE